MRSASMGDLGLRGKGRIIQRGPLWTGSAGRASKRLRIAPNGKTHDPDGMQAMKGFGVFMGCVLAMFAAAAQAQVKATRPASEIPMYGDPDKPNKLSKADLAFIASIEKSGHTREEVSKLTVAQGWDLFRKRDYNSAMKRFNQAWLLDQRNPDAYHGIAAIVAQRDNLPSVAEKFFRVAVAMPGVNANAHVDYGRFLLENFRLDESLIQFQSAIAVAPTAPNARSNASIAYAKKGDFVQACDWAKGARENRDTLADGYLESMCERAAKK